jgi:integrase/recombinase XerD
MTDDLNTLQDAQEKFIDNLRKQKRSTSTILAYGNDIGQLIGFLADRKITQVTTVTPNHIEDFKNLWLKDQYSPKSISRKLNSIKTFFRFLFAKGLLKENPAEGVTPPKLKKEPPRILSKMEYRALRDAARSDPRMSAVVEILLQTGMRIGELGRLEMDDITEKEIRVKSYESHPSRTIPLNRAARRALDRYLEERPKIRSKFLFVTRTGRPFLVRNVRTAVTRYFRLAGIKKAMVNSLRHTFIAYQLANAVPPTLVQRIVGHKRLSTTEKYLDLVKPKAEEKVKLEEL